MRTSGNIMKSLARARPGSTRFGDDKSKVLEDEGAEKVRKNLKKVLDKRKTT